MDKSPDAAASGRGGGIPSVRSQKTLEKWVDEFRRLHYPGAGTIRVMTQDGAGGSDTGLVGFRVPDSPTEIIIEPVSHDDTEWGITFLPRDEPLTVSAAGLQVMASELATLAALCAFLEAKSLEARRHRNV